MTFSPGEVHALIGENGAGKSTLMKILAGIEQPSAGKLYLDGKEVRFHSTRDAAAEGIGIIHQELNMFREMRVADNMFAGNEIARFGVIDRAAQRKRVREVLSRLQLDVDPDEKMMNLRVGQQQIIEIGKTMLKQKLRVLIMDEPTSSLSNAEVEVLFKLIEDLRSQGVAIIYISHRLEEIMRICDKVTVLRDGRRIDSAQVRDIDVNWIIERMVGHAQLTIEKKPYPGDPEPVLEVIDYKLPRLGGGYTVDHVSFTLHRGEVLGIYGLMGAGRTELVESLMGLHPEASGEMVLDGRKITHPVVSEQIARGMVLVPEDRQKDGLVQCMSIFNNMRLTSLKRLSTHGVMREKESRREGRQDRAGSAGKGRRRQPPGHGALGRQPAKGGHRQVPSWRTPRSLSWTSRRAALTWAPRRISSTSCAALPPRAWACFSSAASSRRSCPCAIACWSCPTARSRRTSAARRSGRTRW